MTRRTLDHQNLVHDGWASMRHKRILEENHIGTNFTEDVRRSINEMNYVIKLLDKINEF